MPNETIAHLLHDMRQEIQKSGADEDIEEKWYEHVVAVVEQLEARYEQQLAEATAAFNETLTQITTALKALTQAVEGEAR